MDTSLLSLPGGHHRGSVKIMTANGTGHQHLIVINGTDATMTPITEDKAHEIIHEAESKGFTMSVNRDDMVHTVVTFTPPMSKSMAKAMKRRRERR